MILALAAVLGAEDCNGNGIPDDLDVLPRIAFGIPATIPLAAAAVAAGDLDADGRPDLIAADPAGGRLWVLGHAGDRDFAVKAEPAAASPCGVTIADLDGDGRLDLVAPGGDDGSITLLRNRGGFAFDPGVRLPAGGGTSMAAAADLDGDGSVDLVAVAGTENAAKVFLNRGDGTFAAGAVLPAGSLPRHAEIADLDGDGRADLVVAASGSNAIALFEGKGDGTFRAADAIAVTKEPRCVAAADLDGDGIPDLATANYSSADVAVIPGAGSFTFGPIARCPAGAVPSVAVADLDGDGRPEILAASEDTGRISVLAGVAGVFRISRSIFTGIGICQVQAADLDGDGRIDIVAANPVAKGLAIVWGEEEGPRAPEAITIVTLVVKPTDPAVVVAADLDGDGAPDLAAPVPKKKRLAVAWTGPDGALESARVYPLLPDVVNQPVAVAAVDLDGDGLADLIAIPPQAKTGELGPALVFRGSKAGPSGVPIASPRFARVVTSIWPADVDGDGRTDLVVGEITVRGLVVLANRGEGRLDVNPVVPVDWYLGHVVPADLDGDGDIDVAMYLTDMSFITLRNSGKGGFEVRKECRTDVGMNCMAAADLDDDGRIDLAAGYSGGLAVLLNRNGSFPAAVKSENIDGGAAIVPADLDGDGRRELVTGATHIAVLAPDGGGKFHTAFDIIAEGEWLEESGLIALDLDGDGRIDLARAQHTAETVDVFLATGTREYRKVSLLAGYAPATLAAGDFDGDGLPDLVAGSWGGHQVAVVLRRPAGGFRTPSVAPATNAPAASAVAADLDGDGRLDLVEALWNRATLAVIGGRPGRSFGEPVNYTTSKYALLVAAADLDGDGDLDIAVAEAKSTVDVLSNTGDGVLAPIPKVLTLLAQPDGMAAADFDGDGRADLALTLTGAPEVHLFFGGAGGSLTEGSLALPAGRTASKIAAGDLDGDGSIDLVTATDLGGQTLRGLPGRSFELLPDVLPLDGTAQAIALGDIGGAGRLDVAFLAGDLGRIALGRASATGLHRWVADIDLGTATSIAIADLDGDGKGDLAGTVWIRSGASLVGAEVLAVARNRSAPAASRDDDGDGIPDECEVADRFRRGDADGSGAIDLSDAVSILMHLFLAGPAAPCPAAADADDTGSIDITDAVSILQYLYLAGDEPPDPGPTACGPDPTPDPALGPCAYPAAACR